MIDVLGIDNVLINVADLDEAHNYYGEIFGLPVHFRTPDGTMVLYDLGTETPGLVIRLVDGMATTPPRETPKVWLEVPDARAAAEALKARKVFPIAAPFEIATGWTVEYADPWGNVIGLTDYQKMPALGRMQR
jgi:predicted enzyme related to lactoylglutathione lyase